MIRVQREDFDTGAELERLAAGDHGVGGVASFIGLVRDKGGPDGVSALATCSEDQTVRLWDRFAWRVVATLQDSSRHEAGNACFAFSPDGLEE